MARDSNRAAAPIVRPQFSVRFLFWLTALSTAWMAAGRLFFAEPAQQTTFSLIGLAILVAQLLVPANPRSMSVLATMGVMFCAAPVLGRTDSERAAFFATAFVLAPDWGYLLGAPIHLALRAMRRLDPASFVQVGKADAVDPPPLLRAPSLNEALQTLLQVAIGFLLVVIVVLATVAFIALGF